MTLDQRIALEADIQAFIWNNFDLEPNLKFLIETSFISMFCIKCGGKTEFVSIEGDELKRRSVQGLWIYSLL